MGFVLGIGYVVLFFLVASALSIDYNTLGTSTTAVLRDILVPMALAALILSVLTSVLGWWRPALFDVPSGSGWMWSVPVLLGIGVFIGIDYWQLGAVGVPYVAFLALGTLLVGFNEELVFRGLMIVAFRSGLRESWVWFLSTFLFAVLHGTNALLGQPRATTGVQIVFAFSVGTSFYVVRRLTGSIVPAMLIHGLIDFGSLSYVGGLQATGVDLTTNGLLLVRLLLIVLAFILSLFALRKLFGSAPREAPVSTPTVGQIQAAP